MEYSENIIRDMVMEEIYNNLGIKGSFQGQSKSARFTIENNFIRAICAAEKSLDYKLPNGGSLSHKSDILIIINKKDQTHNKSYISIEIKHKSAVTDQFKTRAFDMLHLKQSYGSQIYGIMLFIKAGTGLSFSHAENICYPFEKFIGINYSEIKKEDIWNELITTIVGYLK